MTRSVGDFVQLALDVVVPGSGLTILKGDRVQIVDVDPENGDLVLFVCRWFEELSHRRNIICMTAEESEAGLA
jgi:hypothetical protein